MNGEVNIWLKILLALSFVFMLISCTPIDYPESFPSISTFTDNNDTSDETIIPGKTECGMPDDISPDGMYICAGHGAFYWELRSEVSGNTPEYSEPSGRYVQSCTTKNNPGVVPGTGSDSPYLPPEVITICEDVWLPDM